MGKLALTLACGDYDRTRALIDGTVSVEGVDLNVIPLSNAWARHQRMVLHEEFDVCELSTSSFLLGRDRGQALVGLPVFPYRMFRHGYVWCSAAAGIREPADLRGKRIGVGMYQITTAMWVRGFLQHDYGVLPEDLTWVTEMPELVPLGGQVRARIEVAPGGAGLEAMLLAGELDAYVGVEGVPPAFEAWDGPPRDRPPGPPMLGGEGRGPASGPGLDREGGGVHRLFPDYRAVEIDYFQRTGLFPIMHTVVVRAALVEAHPWLAVSLVEAFREAKRRGYEYARFPRVSSLAWLPAYQAEERSILGPDPYPYDYYDNLAAIQAMCAYSYEQGMTRRRLAPEELFVPSTLDYPERRAQVGGRIHHDV
jgi:4,5-dihydroxyphthalate decarboxylase